MPQTKYQPSAQELLHAIEYAIDTQDIDWLQLWRDGDPDAVADLQRETETQKALG